MRKGAARFLRKKGIEATICHAGINRQDEILSYDISGTELFVYL